MKDLFRRLHSKTVTGQQKPAVWTSLCVCQHYDCSLSPETAASPV